MREKALKLGFTTALALLLPASAVCSGHTSKAHAAPAHPAAAARPAHAAASAAKAPAHTREATAHSSAGKTTAHASAARESVKLAHGHAIELPVATRKGREAASSPAHKPGRPLTRAEQRAQAAAQAREDARDAALSRSSARHGGKAELASNRHPLREESPTRPNSARSLAELRQPASRQPAFHQPASAPDSRMASLTASRPQPTEEEAAAPPAPLPPISVHHDRKQHFNAAGQLEPSGQPEPSAQPKPSAQPAPSNLLTAPAAPRPQPSSSPLSGVSHPDEMDEQAPLTPAPRTRPAASPTAQLTPQAQPQNQPAGTRLQSVFGIGRQSASNAAAQPPAAQPSATQHAAIGTPLVMAAVTAPPTSAVMTSTQPLPPPALEPQVQPSAAVRARLPSIEAEVVQTQLVPALLYNDQGRLVVPPALKGSREILVHQNTEADREGLARVRDDADLTRMRAQRLLVALPEEPGLAVDDRLPANRRYARPWTAQFLADLARAHYAHFHTDLVVTSAVRTVEVQQRLIRTNGNAAPAEGETASPHLTGQAVDLGKNRLSMTEIAWMRGYLLPLVQQGKVDVEEEFQQACFHISVYRNYAPASAASPASRRAASSLAAALPMK